MLRRSVPSRFGGLPSLWNPATMLGLALLTVVATVGCAPQAGPEGQNAVGTLTILGSPSENYVRGMAKAFELDSGIRTSYLRKSSGEALDAVRQNYGSPVFSVWWGGPIDSYIQAAEEGLL